MMRQGKDSRQTPERLSAKAESHTRIAPQSLTIPKAGEIQGKDGSPVSSHYHRGENEMIKTIITVWPDGEQWIVSRDRVDDEYGAGNNTGSIHSTTLGVHDDNEDACIAAQLFARESGEHVYEQDKHGVPTRLV